MTSGVSVLDTTLRDGAQREGISFSVQDKLCIADRLDDLGITYIEGGWPGANPKDSAFFANAISLNLRHARLVAFGATRKARMSVVEDAGIRALLQAETPAISVVGKSWLWQVLEMLGVSRAENLDMIAETVAYLKAAGREVLFDAEHFFDGYKQDPAYAMQTLAAAAQAGADFLVLCDTNGGTLPSQVTEVVQAVRMALPESAVGIHAHNDTGVAIANTLLAVEAGAVHVQGTINGYGERCGNADLCSVIPNLELKMSRPVLPAGHLVGLADVSRFVSETANLNPDEHAPYVGTSAFTHKAGLHASAMRKDGSSYQHVVPEDVGNRTRVLVSELAGRSNVAAKVKELGLSAGTPAEEQALIVKLKEMENRGYQYEGADGSFELLVRRSRPGYQAPFEVLDFMVVVEKRAANEILAEATVKARVGDQVIHTAADGMGPVNALDTAMRKAIEPFFPQLKGYHLSDFKVRIVDQKAASAALTRVLVESGNGESNWTTVGCSVNIIEASFHALIDSLELPLLRCSSAKAEAVDELAIPQAAGR
ncbi:MAG: citramalate synthase [Chloroflexi bacterium]|nr:citramalate synthase [Chloroflexota bacterium]